MLLWASLIVLCTAAAVASFAGQESTVAASEAVVKRAFVALNEGDLKTLNELFDPDGPWHLPNGKTMPQGGPFTELAKSCPMCAKLEQRNIVIDVMVAEGELVSVRSTWSGLYHRHSPRRFFPSEAGHTGALQYLSRLWWPHS